MKIDIYKDGCAYRVEDIQIGEAFRLKDSDTVYLRTNRVKKGVEPDRVLEEYSRIYYDKVICVDLETGSLVTLGCKNWVTRKGFKVVDNDEI